MTKPTPKAQIQADPTEVVTILTQRIAELEKDKAVLTAALHAQQK